LSSPFDEAKYNALLKGLEVSEVKFSNLKAENVELRIDAEYFQKEYLYEDNSLSKHKIATLGNYAFITDGQHGYYESDSSSNIHMLAARNCKDYFANIIDALPLAKWVDDKNKRSSLSHGDIILSTRGSVGCCAIVYDEVLPANINQDVARIKLNDTEIFSPEFLITYMNCKFGQNWMLRNQTGMVQQGLPLDKVRAIPVPVLSSDFQTQIEKIVKSAHTKLSESKSLYAKAEEILLSELGLKDWQPKNESVSVKKFSDFTASNRLDAEYYQRKYDEIENAIKAYKGGYFTLRDCVKSYSTGYPFDSKSYVEDGYKLIRITNIKSPYLDLSNAVSIPQKDVMLSPRDVVNENDILISMSGTIGNSCVIPAKTKAVINQRILKITPKNYNPMVLSLLINSILCKMLFERIGTGGVQVNISSTDMFKILIPILPLKTQEQIAELIQKSFALRAESKRLLEEAKKMVEAEIEK